MNLWAQRNIFLVTPYHPGAYYDLRSKPDKDGHRQQCTYDNKGKLITHGPGAGTADMGSTFGTHYDQDMKPFQWALELDGGKPGIYVQMYIRCRPIDKKNRTRSRVGVA
jgi:hypothetical protein